MPYRSKDKSNRQSTINQCSLRMEPIGVPPNRYSSPVTGIIGIIEKNDKHCLTGVLLPPSHCKRLGKLLATTSAAGYAPTLHFPTSPAVWLTACGAHLGRKPVKSAQCKTTPLTHGKLSGRRGAFPIVNNLQIATQLLRTFFIVALLLEKGARVLLINDDTATAQIMTRHNSTSPRCSLVTCKSLGAGSCSNWLQICQGIWNWAHCQQLFSHSQSLKRGEGFLKKQQTGVTGLTTMGGSSPRLYFKEQPDVILLLNNNNQLPTESVEGVGKNYGKNLSLISEAQALKIPLLYLADTDFIQIHGSNAKNNGAYPLIGNNSSAHWFSLVSSLPLQLLSYKKLH